MPKSFRYIRGLSPAVLVVISAFSLAPAHAEAARLAEKWLNRPADLASHGQASRDPWKTSQAITPQALAAWLSSAKRKPVIVCVGFQFLYEGAHIPGALYEGPASTRSGLAKLDHWARSLPRTTPLVIYCGCCPMKECPNIRPAFEILRSEGFNHLRVLILPDNLASDWAMKGYPTAKGKSPGRYN